jgi:methionyl-tRNA formyltransferase
MEEGLDTGPIYLEESVEIGASETAGELHDRLSVVSAKIGVATLEQIKTIQPTAQDETRATWAAKISKADGEVDFHQNAIAIDRQIRAYSPWPGGWTSWNNQSLKLKSVKLSPLTGSPRSILSLDPFIIACGEGAIELVQVQAPGRKPVSGRDFANGARLTSGGKL